MPQINPSLPVVGQPDSTEEPKVATALSTIVSTINALDADNLTAGAITSTLLATSAKVLLYTDTSSSTQALGALADITDLSIALTPTVASYYVAILTATSSAPTNEETATFYIDVDGSTPGRMDVAMTTAALAYGSITIAAGTLTAAAHTIKGRVTGSAGTLSATPAHRLYVVTFAQ